MNPDRVTQPATLPFADAALLRHLRMDDTGSLPAHLGEVAQAAVQYIEDYCGISIANQQWTWRLNSFGNRRGDDDFWYHASPIGSPFGNRVIKLPRPVVRSISSITYFDETNSPVTMDSADYQFDAQRGLLSPAPEEYWPQTGSKIYNVEIIFNAGYDDAADVPFALRLALFELISFYFDQASDAGSMVNFSTVPHGFEAKLSQFKQWSM